MRKNILKYLCGLVLLLTGVSSQTTAQIVNGGFETGTFTGWTTNANATVVTSFAQNAWSVTPAGTRMAQIAPTSGTTRSSTETFLGLTQGALTTLNSGLFNTSTNFGSIKQSVALLAGQNITIYWNYVSQDYSPFNDGVFASMVGPGGYQQTKLLAVTTNAYGQPGVIMTGSYGSTAWYAVTFTAGSAGLYTLGMGCFNTGDQAVDPLLFLDNAAGGTVAPGQPTVTTTSASAITTNSALSGGNVTSDGGATVTARGVVYATTPAPTLANTVVSNGTGTGSYVSSLAPLLSGTTYFVRAFATNTAGTSYGNEVSFTTLTGCIAPAFTVCPSTQSLPNTAGTCGRAVTYTATASGTAPALSYTFTGATTGSGSGTGSGAIFNKGTTTVTITASNTCGNANCTFSITVNDTQNPTITAPADVTVSADAGSCAASNVSLGAATFADNCTGATVSDNAPATFNIGNTTVTYTVTDAAGLQATATQIVTVTDNENPTVIAPPSMSVPVDAGSCTATNVVLGAAIISDNCTGASVINDAPAMFPIGSTTVTYTVTDAAGLQATATQIVIVMDNEYPTITAPAAVSASADAGSCAAANVSLGAATFADNCTGATVSNDAPATFNIGNTTVTYTVTDAAGLQSTATQIVTVTDNENPTVIAPPSMSVSADAGSCAATNVVLGTAIISDNCTGASVMNDAPVMFPIGSTTVTYTVTDAAGLQATATQIVIVTDNEYPTIITPAAVTVSADAGSCAAANVVLGTPTFADNCTGATVSNDAPATFAIGNTTVTYIVTDAAGLQSTATQIVTVTDNQNPTITAPIAVSVSADANSCAATNVTLGNANAADNCSGVIITNDAPASFPLGNTTVTYTATDAAGNTATATQVVTVTDNQNPTITAPAAVSVSANAGQCLATNVTLGNANAADNCGAVTITNNAPASYPVGTTTVTYTANDGHGNTATATQVVTVTDNQNPTITAPANITISKYCQAVSDVVLGSATTADNCGVASVTNNAPASYPVGTTTVTWTVTDIHGNIATATQTVTVVPATITVTAITTNNTCNAGTSGAINITVGGGTAPYSYTWSNGAHTEDISGLAAGTYTVTVTDARSCTATSSFTITQPAATGVSAVVSNVKCNGQNNGSIDVTITSGISPYTYNWGGGITTQDRTNLAPGTYTLVVTNGIGCTVTSVYTITQPAPLAISGTATDVTCYGDHNGAIDVTVTGGTQPYNYKWADVNQTTLIPWILFYFSQWCNTNYNWPGSTINQQDRSGLYPGYYWVQTTDANGCKANTDFSIDQPSPLCVSGNKTHVTCNGGNNGAVNQSVSGGTAPYTYAWSNGATTQDVTGLPAGNHTCTITDAHGCVQVNSYSITQPSAFTASIGVSPTYTVSGQQAYTIYLGYGPQTVQLQASASGGSGGYSYDWAHTTSNNSCVNVSPTTTTTYTLTVTDCKGCVSVITRTIYVRNVQASNNKINVCHNGVTTAVSNGQVQQHLNHGDQLGACLVAARFANTEGEEGDTHEELSQLAEDFSFSVYPNPTSGVFTVELPKAGNTEVIITDLSGKIVERRMITDNASQKILFDLQDKAKGIYMIKVINANQVHQAKITLQ